jgi:hypothetical protein
MFICIPLITVWGNAHITVRSHEATGSSAEGASAGDNGSSNSAQDQASLVSTTPAQRANSFVYQCGYWDSSVKPQSELITMWGRYPHRRIETSSHNRTNQSGKLFLMDAIQEVPPTLSTEDGTTSTFQNVFFFGTLDKSQSIIH